MSNSIDSSINNTNTSHKNDLYQDEILQEEENKEYMNMLKQANELDFHDLEESQCVLITYHHLTKQPIIQFYPYLGLIQYQDNINEQINRIFLYFIKKSHEEVYKGDYILIYGHSKMNIISHQSIIYKYYQIMPRRYKKYLKKLYILHPQFGIRIFYELARAIISYKFYQKIQLINTIHELQLIFPVNILKLPMKLIIQEDDDNQLQYISNNFPSLLETFCIKVYCSRMIFDCIEYLRNHNGLTHVGLFRIAGIESHLKVAKIRLQRKYTKLYDNVLHHEKILFGDSLICTNEEVKIDETNSYSPTSIMNTFIPYFSSSNSSKIAVAIFDNIDTVAQILKFILRELPEPVVDFISYEKLSIITQKFKANSISRDEWEIEVQNIFDLMPDHFRDTLSYILKFLNEVSQNSNVNNMTTNNLVTIFATSILRSKASSKSNNPTLFLQELGLNSIILAYFIDCTYFHDISHRK